MSKGVFFLRSDLPQNGPAQDRVLLRALGSPDPYRQQIDGMGGATSSTSKVVVVWPSSAGAWRVTKVLLSRNARRLMEGSVLVLADVFAEHGKRRD